MGTWQQHRDGRSAALSAIVTVEEGSKLTVLLMLMSRIMENSHCKFKMLHFQLEHVQHSSTHQPGPGSPGSLASS